MRATSWDGDVRTVCERRGSDSVLDEDDDDDDGGVTLCVVRGGDLEERTCLRVWTGVGGGAKVGVDSASGGSL